MDERISIDVQYPELDHAGCVADIKLEITKVNGNVCIQNICEPETDSKPFINIINFGNSEFIRFIAGDAYPNSMLGDAIVQIHKGISAINVADMLRFIRNDRSIYINFPREFNGAIYVISSFKS